MGQTVSAARRTLFWLGLYAAAMAFVEAAVVVYLRRLYYPDNLQRIFPMRVWSGVDLAVELGREAATIAMILAVALLAERGLVRRTAAFLFVFGVWDLFYYAWLKVAIGWPVSWTEWDILFLIPWSWLAPWLAPATVALIFTLWGGWILAGGDEPALRPGAVAAVVAGLLLVLGSFLAPALPLLRGAAAAETFVPARFLWALYVPGLATLVVGLLRCRR